MLPDFHSRAVLLQHIRHTRSFYDPRCVDPSGGFYHFYKDDGTVYDAHTRHLVSSTRFVFNFAMAWRQFHDPADQQRMLHGLRFLREAHRNRTAAAMPGYSTGTRARSASSTAPITATAWPSCCWPMRMR
jgi:mannose/cellobiose epimerase-like protein (N-acyl-D-glucosamine 2-epimerase family)